jgi:hypothetical protein
MKKLSLLLILVLFDLLSLFAQTPDAFNYQAVVRDNSGNPVLNHMVGFRISILQTSSSGTVVYSEIQAPTTNEFGLVNIEIGKGTLISGSMQNIDWSTGVYYLKIEIDINGGVNYSDMGTSQLLSVPYAKYAATSGPAGAIHYISIPASSLSIDPASTYVKRNYNGILWQAGYQGQATCLFAIPSDWDGKTDMTMDLYFSIWGTSTAGLVSFFTRSSGINPGDHEYDPGSISTKGILVSGTDLSILYKQTFNIPVSKLTGKSLFYIYSIQRGGTGETYTGDVILQSVRIGYKSK